MIDRKCATRRLRNVAGLIVVLLASGRLAWAQVGPSVPAAPAAPAAKTEPPKDALGRDTPRGTVLGFMSAARKGRDEITPQYLDTSLKGQDAVDLARQLYVVLDSRLPARLANLSDRPEGRLDNPLKPDQDVVGTISTASGTFDLVVERVSSGNGAPVWLFSHMTLLYIPSAYEEIDLVKLDRFVPDAIAKPRVAGVRLFDWLLVVLVLPVCYRALGALNWLFKPLIVRVQRRFGAREGRLPGLVHFGLIGIAIRWILASIDLPLIERQLWAGIATLLLVVAFGWFLLLIVGVGERYIRTRFLTSGENASLLRLARRFVDLLVLVGCGLATLHYFGFDPTAALAGLGIGGIAVALAAQKTLENVIAGMSLIFDKAVHVGDTLKFGEIVGTVEFIGLRSTSIRTLDRTILSVPNGQIASAGIEILSERDKYWFHHFVGLQYGTTADQMRSVIDGIHALLVTHAEVDSDSARVRFLRVGPSSLDIEVFAYVVAADWNRFLEIQQELLLHIMEVVQASGTDLAFPSQMLHIADARNAASGSLKVQEEFERFGRRANGEPLEPSENLSNLSNPLHHLNDAGRWAPGPRPRHHILRPSTTGREPRPG